MKTGTGSRRRGFALVLVGLVLGGALWASPATSHVAGWTHNWVQHIRPKADVRYYTKAQANARYVARGDVDGSRVTAVATEVPLLLNVGGNGSRAVRAERRIARVSSNMSGADDSGDGRRHRDDRRCEHRVIELPRAAGCSPRRASTSSRSPGGPDWRD